MVVRKAQLHQARLQDGRQARHALGDALQALGAVIDGVHAGDDRRQHLRGADVAGGFFAANVLLARLQRQPVRGLPVHVHAHAHKAPGQRALERVLARHVGGVRAAGAHGHAQALRVAHHDVGAHLAGRLEQREGQQVGGKDRGRALGLDLLDLIAPVHQPAAAGGVLDERGEVIVLRDRRVPLGGRVGPLERQAQRLGARLHHLQGLRVRIAEHHDHVAFGLDRAARQRHRLGGGRGLVQHRGVGDVHAGEVGHQGLEVDQRFHAALRNLGLIRRVGGVPGRVLQDVAQDDAGRVRAVVALADEALEQPVLPRDRLQLGQRVGLACRRGQVHRRGARDRARHDGVDQPGRGRLADDGQHLPLVLRGQADVAGDEFAGVLKVVQGRVAHGGTNGSGASNTGAAGARQAGASGRFDLKPARKRAGARDTSGAVSPC